MRDLLPLATLREIHRHAECLRGVAEANLDTAFNPVLSRRLDALVQAEEALGAWIHERETRAVAA